MPTAPAGPWLEQAIAKGLIRATSSPSRGVVSLTDAPPPGASEKAFQAAVIQLAEANGWRVYHTHNSKRSAAGWPDLALVRNGVLILSELKTDTGKVSPDQEKWLTLLRAVPGVRVRLWRPSLWAAIVAELSEQK